MTSQTKKYIELSDFLALRLTCKGCGSALDIPISKPLNGREDTEKLNNCPICLRLWALREGGTYHPAIAGFTSALATLANVLEVGQVGFSLALEVTDEKPKDSKP
jgi:hypothetical protein